MRRSTLNVARVAPVKGLVRLALLVLGGAAVLLPAQGRANDFCPNIYDQGGFDLPFNPAFTYMAEMNFGGSSYDGLIVTSFFNAIKTADGTSTVDFYERDLVARITGVGYRSPAWWSPSQAEILTDLDVTSPVTPNGPGQQVWPNEAERVPDGVLPFEAIVSPQGFHPTPSPGRLTLINLDDPSREEFIIHQSRQEGGPCKIDPADPNYSEGQQPRFYHVVKWVDMDSDGLKDAVTVRSGFKVNGAFCLAPAGEVVWFKNPGASIDANTPWDEFIITEYPLNATGPDIAIDMADFEGDGVPEIVATNFFTGEVISLYGAPVGDSDWSTVNTDTNPPRIATISNGQGRPFGVRISDLNRDGKPDVLATNHQSDGCFRRTQDPIPGRVYVLEQPASGDIFNDPWTTHIIKDNIRPNPTYPAPNNDPNGPGRLAPGLAQEFWPTPWDEATSRPWILVGGDEASKAWLLKPTSQDPSNWDYDSAVIFDINDTYGANTSQSFSAPPPATGVSVSTLGSLSWRYDRDWAWGAYAEIYIPVFEGRQIRRISFRPGDPATKVACPADGSIACPVF